MKKLVLCISTLAILAIACQKLENNVPLNGDEMAPAVKMITETISGSRGVETKATIADDDASFAWTAGDNVAVHVSSVSNVSNGKFVYTSDEGASGAAPDTDNPAKASFTVVYPADYSRDAFAVYPSTIVAEDGLSGSTLNVTLPPSYPLAEVSGETGETSPCPMIADNTGASWSFYQLCSLLRLTVNGIPADATGLVIRFPGKKVNGAFSIASVTPGTSTIATGVPDDGEDKITVSFDAGIPKASRIESRSILARMQLPTPSAAAASVMRVSAMAISISVHFAFSDASYVGTTKSVGCSPSFGCPSSFGSADAQWVNGNIFSTISGERTTKKRSCWRFDAELASRAASMIFSSTFSGIARDWSNRR